MSIFDFLFGRKPKESKEDKETIEPSLTPHTPDFYIGQKIKDRYFIEKQIGKGGLGVVFQGRDHFGASDISYAKRVAIKLLLSNNEHEQDDWLKRKFRQEIEALARVQHPYIVEIIDTGDMPDGTPFFVMQFLEGRQLRALIKKGGVDLQQTATIIRQVSQALEAVHKEHIYHRDLKPENIFLQKVSDDEEQVKVIDFGVARVESSFFSNTTNPIAVGTIPYMAPEQFNGEVYKATDIYALGVIAYEMVTGERPFKGQVQVAQYFGLKQLPSNLRPDLPLEAEKAIVKALSFDHTQRQSTITEFADEFIKGFSTTLLLNSQKKTLKLSAKTDSAQPDSGATLMLEPVGGAVVLESPFYLLRPTDADFQAAITRRDSIVLVKGARQMGKTSLLARGLQQARSLGAKVVLTDFQMLSEEHFRSSDSLFLALAQTYADQFDLPTLPNDVWKSQRGPTINLQRYIQKEVLGQLSQPIVWGLDEVDRLLAYPYASEFFGLLRSWHNARALEPSGSWHKLTIAIAYATEAHLLIADPNQSPFNVGTQILLKDFTLEEVAELNRRHKYPLKSHAEVERLFSLLGGQPYLVRCALYEMVNRKMSIDELEETGSNSIFADHLQRILQIIRRDKTIAASVLTIVEGGRCNDEAAFYRLRSAGIMSGNSASTMKPRCQLYENFLRVNLRDS